ncbi:uncharacterized protein LOC134246126, partial [Saccostrea cucullata]|uniref:uncharacterized protein LOC134246126 n=1 Tax=Saccostrea cuccullata TaxID=36930 RepID=UPI002ED615B5
YDCCAVNEVTGTTNDFDTTPWCTTSGSCQLTNSQIPKSCCKDTSEDDYQYAETSCHAIVRVGTYKEGCFQRLKSLNDVSIDVFHTQVLCTFVFLLGIIKVLDLFFACISCYGMVRYYLYKIRHWCALCRHRATCIEDTQMNENTKMTENTKMAQNTQTTQNTQIAQNTQRTKNTKMAMPDNTVDNSDV